MTRTPSFVPSSTACSISPGPSAFWLRQCVAWLLTFCFGFPGLAAAASSNDEVTYTVSLAQAQTQMVEITAAFPAQGRSEVLVHLPTWRPGRYEILDPVGTLRAIRVTDENGSDLPFEKTAKSSWRIHSAGADEIHVVYQIYANSIADRTRHVDSTHAFLSGSSVFLYDQGSRRSPVRVVLQMPTGWRVAGGLELAPNETKVLVAPNYDVLVDSPLELGLHDKHTFEAAGLPHEIIVWPKGLDYDVKQVIEDITKIVEEQFSIFGSAPYERYVFLVHAGAGGGGTEHLNSTIMQTSRDALEGSHDRSGSYKSFLGLVAHEFFHTWNVKAFRPTGMHPYDYLKENYTDLLWVAEGSTTYYSALTQARAGLKTEQSYLDGLASSIGSHLRNPGAQVQSLASSSFDAWTHFNSHSADDGNTEISFYSGGSLASLALDMEVRARSQGKASFDDVLRVVYERYPLSGPGYSTRDLIGVLDELTGSSFQGFFHRHIASTEPFPFEEELKAVGLELYFEPAKQDKDDEKGEDDKVEPSGPPLKADLGLRLRDGGSGCLVRSVSSEGPAYGAGLVVGDEIIAMDGKRLRSSDLSDRLKRLAIGDTVTFTLIRHEHLFELSVEVAGIEDGKWKIKRIKQASDAQRSSYASWIGHEWPASKDKDKQDEAVVADEPESHKE